MQLARCQLIRKGLSWGLFFIPRELRKHRGESFKAQRALIPWCRCFNLKFEKLEVHHRFYYKKGSNSVLDDQLLISSALEIPKLQACFLTSKVTIHHVLRSYCLY